MAIAPQHLSDLPRARRLCFFFSQSAAVADTTWQFKGEGHGGNMRQLSRQNKAEQPATLPPLKANTAKDVQEIANEAEGTARGKAW